MALISSNCICISSSSTLLSPLLSHPNSYQNSVKLNRNSVGNNRSKSQGKIRAQKTDSLVQLVNRKNTSSNSALEQLDIERGVCVPFRKYTPELVRNEVLESRGTTLSLIGRGVAIVWNLGLYWSALMYDCFVGRDEEVGPSRACQLRNLLCDLGPSFIKAGQDPGTSKHHWFCYWQTANHVFRSSSSHWK